MGALVHCSSVRYAVVQASSRKYSSDHFVIAYQDEKCLRDLIAAPSILGVGFESREEAMAKFEDQVSHTAPSKEQPRVSTMFDGTHQNRDVAGGHDVVEHREFCVAFCSPLLARLSFFFTRRTRSPE
jgi:hypothetical protein